MAPEVVLSKPYNEKVDVFSFGILLWTIAKNESPFTGFSKSMHKERVVLKGERPKLDSSWPVEFKTLLMDCWEEVASRRPDFIEISMRITGLLIKLENKLDKLEINEISMTSMTSVSITTPTITTKKIASTSRIRALFGSISLNTSKTIKYMK